VAATTVAPPPWLDGQSDPPAAPPSAIRTSPAPVTSIALRAGTASAACEAPSVARIQPGGTRAGAFRSLRAKQCRSITVAVAKLRSASRMSCLGGSTSRRVGAGRRGAVCCVHTRRARAPRRRGSPPWRHRPVALGRCAARRRQRPARAGVAAGALSALLLDASVWLAALDADDDHHSAATQLVQAAAEGTVTFAAAAQRFSRPTSQRESRAGIPSPARRRLSRELPPLGIVVTHQHGPAVPRPPLAAGGRCQMPTM